MADKKIQTTPLTIAEIIVRADAQIIKQAYETRLKIDAILKERAAAYQKIATLEQQIDGIVGEPGLFAFPEPPVQVSGYTLKKPVTAKNAAPAPAQPPVESETPKAETVPAESAEKEPREQAAPAPKEKEQKKASKKG